MPIASLSLAPTAISILPDRVKGYALDLASLPTRPEAGDLLRVAIACEAILSHVTAALDTALMDVESKCPRIDRAFRKDMHDKLVRAQQFLTEQIEAECYELQNDRYASTGIVMPRRR